MFLKDMGSNLNIKVWVPKLLKHYAKRIKVLSQNQTCLVTIRVHPKLNMYNPNFHSNSSSRSILETEFIIYYCN